MGYERASDGPVLTGDELPEGVVIGFAYRSTAEPTSADDRLILDADEPVTSPPQRIPPLTAEAVIAPAPSPPERLAATRRHAAVDFDAELPARMAHLLAALDRPWSGVASPLLSGLHTAGHIAWIAGGAARDVIGGGAADIVKDLDLTGTAPTGRFCELARRTLRRLGGEYRVKVSPDSLVCSAQPAAENERYFEYRALNTAAFPFPASGSDIEADAGTRDFTINTIYYDTAENEIADPTGRGLADLDRAPRVLVPITKTRPAAQEAALLLRAVKFVERWRDGLDIESPEMREWLNSHPEDFAARLDQSDLTRLARVFHRTFDKIDPADVQSAAKRLSVSATKLVETLSVSPR